MVSKSHNVVSIGPVSYGVVFRVPPPQMQDEWRAPFARKPLAVRVRAPVPVEVDLSGPRCRTEKMRLTRSPSV